MVCKPLPNRAIDVQAHAGRAAPVAAGDRRWPGWPRWHQSLPHGTDTTQPARTQVLDLRSSVDHLPHRCLKRQPVHGLAITNPQSSPFLTPAYLKSLFHQVSRLSNLTDVQAEQDRYTKSPKSHQVKYPMVLFIHEDEISVNFPGYCLRQFLRPSDKGIQG